MIDTDLAATLAALLIAGLSALGLLLWWIASDIERTCDLDDETRRWLDEGRG